MDLGRPVSKASHPRETTNILSRLSFFYNIKLFIKGYRKGVETDDLYDVLKNCRSQELGDELEKQWKIEESKSGKPSICRALWVCYGKIFVILGLIQLVVKTTTTAWSPEALSKLISYFSPDQKDLTKEDAIYYACVVIGLTIVNLFFYHNFVLAQTELGIRVRTAVCSLIYRKTLKMSSASLSKVTVGQIVTIMTKDTDAFFMFIYYGNDVWVGFVQTGVICYLIYSKIGVASFAGITFFLIVLPLQAFIGKMSYALRLKSSKKTDERLELIQEVLSAIKMIKMYTWEKYFEKKINSARKEELRKVHKLFLSKIWIVVIGSICSKITFFIFFVTYVWMGNSETNVTAEIVFYILSCLNELEYSFSTLIPLGLSFAAEVYATAKRVETILTVKELPFKQELISDSSHPKIILSGVSVKLNSRSIFENVFLNIEKGLNVIVGHTGSGKTTFLKAILQECQMDGDVKISGRISYASQEPWLFPATIRNNILFGEKYCDKRYRQILKICSLDYDLELFSEGDSTIVGDHGINLSKGQQTRINLARAVYKESDIYLLDDCLASLDTYVSTYVFKECICKFLQNKLCVFVTNNPNYIQKAEKIILIDQGSVKISEKFEVVQESTIIEDNKEVQKSNEIVDCELYTETKKSGKVHLRDYHKYVIHGGGIFVFSLLIVLFIAAQGTSSYSDKLMSDWVTLEQNLSNYKKLNQTNSTKYDELTSERSFDLHLYIIIVLSSILLNLVKFFAFFNFSRRASINLHKAMVRNVIKSTMTFFDSNFLGSILNRFSKDCLILDECLPFVIIACLSMVFTACGGIILLTTVNIIFLLESLVLIAFAYLLKRFCQPTGRNLQRLNVATRSPMIGHINSTLEGLTTIRASSVQERVINEFDNHQNLFTSANYMLSNCQIALGFGLDFFCALFITLVIVQFLITDMDPSVGDVGLAITQSFVITEIITTGISNVSECENLMTSVERMVEYTQLEEESQNGTILKDWPCHGHINFSQVSLNYGNSSKETLEAINFGIKSKEKLGIVGRTGAGKSSILASFFRLYQTKGKITIDEVDIQNVSLHWLRSNISVIPQDPFLFSGTIRENLDPLMQFREEQIWKILDQLRMKHLIPDLHFTIDKGSSFSAGQKQLLCLARAILRKNKIVVLDEATANVDQETDALIQEAVQNHFSESTVIIIAHKLVSILSCDKVLVLDKGRISEFGDPVLLLQKKNSFLCSVIK